MERYSWPNILKVSGGIALLFLLAAYKADFRVATFFLASGIIGWLNVFGIVHAVLALLRGQRLSYATISIVVIALLGNLGIFYFGQWPVLTLCTLSFLLIDALVLHFNSPPLGFSSREP